MSTLAVTVLTISKWLAGLKGLTISNATGTFVDLGYSAIPSSGHCADLSA